MSTPPAREKLTLDQALRRLRELEEVFRIARPVIASVALRKGDELQGKAERALVQLDALGIR